jgi:hypothetical protein
MYQKIVIAVASITLIVLLIVIGYSIHSTTSTTAWPPIVNNCPDYWKDYSGNGEQCVNAHHLGTCNIPTPDDRNAKNFNTAPFMGDMGTCEKYNWANACGVTWDGITYGVANPCDDSTL